MVAGVSPYYGRAVSRSGENDTTSDYGMSDDLLDTTIGRVVDRAAERYRELEGLVDGEIRLTVREMVDAIDRHARALIGSGIQGGDTVAVWAPNSAAWVVAALAVHRAGAVLVPINTRFKGPEAAYVLARSRAKALFTVTDFLEMDYVAALEAVRAGDDTAGGMSQLTGMPSDMAHLTDIIVMSGPTTAPGISLDSFVRRGDGVDPAEVKRRVEAVQPTDIALIMFTSGTTGHPKGVMVAHGPVVRAFDVWGSVLGIVEGDRYLIVNPLFHAFGFNSGVLPSLIKGATMVIHAVFEVETVLDLVERERISVWPGPPAVYQSVLNHPDLARWDLSSLRRSVTGAATIPVEMVTGMRERMGFETIITAYGLTETSGIVSMCRPEDDPELIASTSGRAIPGSEMRIAGDDGAPLVPGEPGEIWVRGYQVMAGYLDDPEQTAETVDADGWLHTGDIGVMDANGYVDITDRMKDMYIVGGFNAYPAEIERTMLEHPGIGQVAVIGIPDDRLGEVGAAFIVPSPSGAPVEEELIGWCRERMANYKAPRRIWTVESLPLNASNKVLKGDLRGLAATLAEPGPR